MSYMSIPNLYKDTTILDLFKHCYAMEKIHGTSAHISYKDGRVAFFAGGDKYEDFIKHFDEAELKKRLDAKIEDGTSVHVYGENYGGKIMGMSETYGKDKRFVAFEVKIGDKWLNVPKAESFVHSLGLEFVAYKEIPCTIEALDAARDEESVQAARNGMGQGHLREGIVIRPLLEYTSNNGERLIAKHKGEKFSERKSKKDTMLDPGVAIIKFEAKGIAEEWVTDMRLNHVLDKLRVDPVSENLGKIIPAMQEDVLREGEGEFKQSKEINKAIGRKTVELVKQRERNRVTS